MRFFHSPAHRISNLSQKSTAQHCVQSRSRVASGLLGTTAGAPEPHADGAGSGETSFRSERSARVEYLTFTSPIGFRTLHLQIQQKFVENRTVISNTVAIYNVLL